MKRQFGRGYAADARDNDYHISPLARLQDRSRYWTRQWIGDQEESSHCVGYAFVHWLATPPFARWARPEGIYEFAKTLDEWVGEDYEGTSVRAGAKVLRRLGFISRFEWAQNVEDIITTVLRLGPVVVGTEWFGDMMEPNSDNMIFATGESYGGHAYIIDGVDVDKRIFRITNSWGKEWGEGGRALIGWTDMHRLMTRQGEACSPIEARPWGEIW